MDVRHRVTAKIDGRVQGVGFRYFARSEARRLALVGWVRNDRDGGVTLVAEGPREDVERLVETLRAGPATSHVRNVSVGWEAATGEFKDFSVRYQ